MERAFGQFNLLSFFEWWGQELRSLLPRSNRASQAFIPQLTLAVEQDVLRIDGKEASRIGFEAAPEGAISTAQMLAYLASVKPKALCSTVGLRLPYASCYTRTLELPALARRDFASLLSLDLERSTPFKHKEILTSYTASDAPDAKGHVQVRQFIVKRRAVESLKSQIEALGYRVIRVDCTSQDGIEAAPVNFLAAPAERPRPMTSLFQIITGILAASLLASAVYIYANRLENALSALQVEISDLKVKVSSQKEAVLKSQALFADVENYDMLKRGAIPKALILEELTRLLPDSAWVTELKMDSTNIEMTGLADSSAPLVPLLERSSAFVDAAFTSSQTYDPREEKERFAIRARIRPPALAAVRVQGGSQ